MRRVILATLLSLSCALPLRGAKQHAPPVVVETGNPDNRPEQTAKPYVVLVSLDGFRPDYAGVYGAPHLQAMAREGASASEGMLPAYPASSIVNQYTLVTGLYAGHHGIVANRFYDPVRKQRYDGYDADLRADGSWYRGIPLWAVAEQQGIRTATVSWAGSEAKIAGQRPSYYTRFDQSVADEARVDQALAWLKLPDARRPHLIVVALSGVTRAALAYGPESPEAREAVHRADALVGSLRSRLSALHLPVDLLVVSDCGLAARQGDWIDLEQYLDLGDAPTERALLYPATEEAAAAAYRKLRIVSDKFMVYRRDRTPPALHYGNDPRIGDPVIVPTGPYAIRAHKPAAGTPNHGSGDSLPKAVEGADAHTVPQMRAIFYAAGPDIHSGVTLRPFDNVNVFPLIAEILKLDAPATDGSIGVLEPVLAAPPAAP